MDENLKKRIIEAQQGNKEVLNELVIENRGLIINISKRFENRGLEFDDIYQIGAIGFIKAVQKFDFSYNVMLSTFAVSYIIGDRISNKDWVEDRVVNSLALKQCLDNLTNREKKIIYLRYYKNQTQKKVADIIGISQVQVSRIEKKILENLGKELKEA